MKKRLVTVIAGVMALVMLVPTVMSCTSDGDKEKTTVTEEQEIIEPERDTEALLASSVYAANGLEYVLHVCEKYYNKRNSTVKRALTQARDAEIWYVASYIEMLAEAYKLYPDNATLKSYYIDVLDKCLPKYEVKGATITPKGGKRYTNQTYYNAGPNSSGDFYYDDNAWICYQLLEAYELLGDAKYLEKGEKVLEFLWTGKKDGNLPGIHWSKDFGSDFSTCATSPTATCMLKAYMITEKEEYLTRGKQLYDEVKATVKDGGLYHAGKSNGGMDPWKPSYDQGTMMLNGVLLYKITGDKTYYNDARSTSTAVIGHSFTVNGRGDTLTVKMNTNPYYCPWAFAWLVRGVMAFYDINEKPNESFMTYLKKVLDERSEIKDRNGLYDPYFGIDDWVGNGRMFETSDLLLMPTGYAQLLLMCGYFDVYQSADALKALNAAE